MLPLDWHAGPSFAGFPEQGVKENRTLVLKMKHQKVWLFRIDFVSLI